MSTSHRRIYFAVLGIVLMTAVLFAIRPSPVIGIDGATLSDSLNGNAPCEQVEAKSWRCPVTYVGPDSYRTYSVYYDVDVDALGCWDARRQGGDETGTKVSMSGCITLLDL